jgi:hypothetical protein
MSIARKRFLLWLAIMAVPIAPAVLGYQQTSCVIPQ